MQAVRFGTDEQQLKASREPSAIVVLANWAVQQAGKDDERRLGLKWDLTRRLFEIELKKADTREPYGMVFVRFQLDATTGGPVRLNFGSVKGLRLWLGSAPVPVQDATTLDVPSGLHTLTLAVDLAERKDPLRCELDDVSASPARVRVVGGK